ncbi:MAG: SCO family protein [Hyphomicrobiaceae bacterium]
MATTNPLRRVRLVLWGVAALAVLVGGALLLGEAQRAQRAGLGMPAAAGVGGPFVLTRSDGSRFDSKALVGKPYAMFFGFTHCPDICPTTLMEMTNHLASLGTRAGDLNVLFVTVDPARDTPEHLKLYLSAFDKRIIGLTGTNDEIKAVTKAYRAYAEKVPSADGTSYTMNHTASVYLMDRAGRLVSTLSFEEPETSRQKKIDNLLAR